MPRGRGHRVQITVLEVLKGKCPLGMVPGRTWHVENNFTPEKMCQTAFNAIYPALRTLRYGGHTPGHNPDMTKVGCPDPTHVVVFELKKLPDEESAEKPSETT